MTTCTKKRFASRFFGGARVSAAWAVASLVCMFRVGWDPNSTWLSVLPAFVATCAWAWTLCDDLLRGCLN